MSTRQERRRLAQQVRCMIRTDRAQRRARRQIATKTPQPARTWLVDLGVSPEFAAQYASAFSRGVVPEIVTTTKIKPRKDSRRSERNVLVKSFNFRTIMARLVGGTTYAAYRPKNNPIAAAEFHRAAAAPTS